MAVDRRRALLLLGGTAGAAALGAWSLAPPSPSRVLDDPRALAVRFLERLDDDGRARAWVPYDHPLRQYFNRGVPGGGAFVLSLPRAARAVVVDLLHAGLSARGRELVPREYYTRFPGVHAMKVLVCGDPRAGPWQVVLTGPHLNLRLGGANAEGVVFGGVQVYGDQRGDGVAGLPGNLWRAQHETAIRLLATLDERQRRAAVLPTSPGQLRVDLRGRRVDAPGVAVSSLSADGRALAGAFVADVLATYPPDDVAAARRALDANGGVAGLRAAWYADADLGAGPQTFRLEGPAAVLHFRGAPHVHAFAHVAVDGDAPRGVGPLVGDNPAPLADGELRALFEAALRTTTAADVGYVPMESIVGFLPAGAVREGDVYVAESWGDAAVVVDVASTALPTPVVHALRARGDDPAARRSFTIATTAYAARSLDGARIADAGAVRDVVIAHARARGFTVPRADDA